MADKSTFDPDAFMAKRQQSPSSGAAFDPDVFMSSRAHDGVKEIPPSQTQVLTHPPAVMDRVSTEVNQGGKMLEPESVVRGIEDSLGRTTQAWGDMFSGRVNPSTLAEMVPLVGPMAVDASRKMFTPGQRVEGLTDAAMMLAPSRVIGGELEARAPYQYVGENPPKLQTGRTIIPEVPASAIDATRMIPGAAPIRVAARTANALGRVLNKPAPGAVATKAMDYFDTPLPRRVYDVSKAPMNPWPDTRPLADISDRGILGRDPIAGPSRFTSDEFQFESNRPLQVTKPLLPQAWQIPNKSYPLPSKEVAPITDSRSMSYSPLSPSRTPTADELEFESNRPFQSRNPLVAPRQSSDIDQPLPRDTPSSARSRANTSRAKFDENGKRNQLKK